MFRVHSIRLATVLAVLAGAILSGCGSKPPGPGGPGGGGGGNGGGGNDGSGNGAPTGAWTTRETVVLTAAQARQVVPKSFRVSPDGRRFAYVLAESGGHVVVVDGVKDAIVYQQVADVRFSGDGKDAAVAGVAPGARSTDGSRPVVRLNGKAIYPQIPDSAGVMKDDPPELLAVADGRVLYTVRAVAQTREVEFTFADDALLASRDHFDGPCLIVGKLKGAAAFARRDVGRTVWNQYGVVAGTEDAVFSPNGAAWGAIFRKGQEYEVVIDGEVRKTFPQASGFAFSPDGKRHAYFAARPETQKSYLVVDGVVKENPGGTGVGFAFSTDGSRWAAQTTTRVIVDGVPQREYASVPGKSRYVRQVTESVPTVAFSPDGKHVAYLAAQTQRRGADGTVSYDPHAFVVVDGKEGKEWAAVGNEVFWSADNRTVGYAATPAGKKAAVVVVGDATWPEFDEVIPLGFSADGRSFAARVRHTEQQSVVLDGHRRGQYEEIGLGGTRVGFTPAGKVTYLARKPDNSVVWVEELRGDLPDDGGPRVAVAPKGGAAANGWVPLFNGRDLSNWKYPELSESPHYTSKPANMVKWAVADGAITFTGRDYSHLVTAGTEFRRFHLRMEVKTSPGAKVPLEFGGRAVEVSIDNTRPKWRTGSLSSEINSPGDGVTEPLAADDEWFTLEVLSTGDRVVTRVNGKRAAEAKTPGLPAGPIRFFVHPDHPAPFAVRKIEYRPLEDEADLDRPGELRKPEPGPKAAADPLLAPVEGFTPLFNGKDTAGWVTDRGGKEWEVRDGKLFASVQGGHVTMFTEKEYRDFHLRVVAKTAVGASAGIFFRAGEPKRFANKYYATHLNNAERTDKPTGALTGTSINTQKGARPGAEDGKWALVEVIAAGRRLTTKVNGRVVADFTDEATRLPNGRVIDAALLGGRIGVMTDAMSNGSPVEIARIDIRELK